MGGSIFIPVGLVRKREKAQIEARFANRDFESAIRSELPVMYRVARRMATCQDDAEDLVQKTLVAALSGWAAFDGRFLRAWLLKILHRENLARFRNQEESVVLDAELDAACPNDLWTEVLTRDQIGRIFTELEKLEKHHRIVIQLCDVEGMTYEEVSEILGVPIGTVRSRLFRGRAALRTRLSDIGEFHEA